MKFKKITARIKAVAVTAAMMATTLITPSIASLSTVTAADVNVNHKFTCVPPTTDEDAPNKAKISVSGLEGSSTITFNFETSYSGNVTFGVYGGEISKDPWWYKDDQQYETTAKNGKASFTYNVPSEYKDIIKTVGIGVWYPNDGTFTLTTASSTGTSTGPVGPTNPGTPDLPTSENDKSGAWDFKDNGDGTATITSTLTGEYEFPEEYKDGYVLTQGYDEETMYGKDNPYEEGMPINAHKFPLNGFGIKDTLKNDTKYKENFQIQSFEYIIESDYDLTNFQYGGGINVERGKTEKDEEGNEVLVKGQAGADTEIVKGKNGYWYNDQGDVDMEKYGDAFKENLVNGFTPHGAYVAENMGKYAKVVWDVPKDVQPYVDTQGGASVSFQYWYGTSDELENAETPAVAAEGEEGEGSGPSNVVKEIRLKGATCTYTKTAIVPYNKTITKKVGASITAGDDSTNKHEYMLTDLGLEERDLISAVKFNVSSSENIGKLVSAMGISVDLENSIAEKGWYQTGNVLVLDAGKTQSIMWIVPSAIRNDVSAIYEDSKVMFGYWYGESGKSITLDSIDFYAYESVEEELKIVPSELKIAVGETKYIKPNVDGCTADLAAGQVSGLINIGEFEAGKGIGIEAIKPGLTYVEVTSPEGQVVKVKVEVTGSAETTTDPSSSGTTTTAPTTVISITTTKPVTQNPDDVIDWSKVKYGDVNIDDNVDSLDIVLLNKYLLEPEKTPLTATQKENADCEYDHEWNMSDAGKLINYVAELIPIEKLGDPDFYKK